MSTECTCTNPDGGGTKCPIQHVAICIRGKDLECYGTCVRIPDRHTNISNRFNQWLYASIQDEVQIYANRNYSREMSVFGLEMLSQSDLSDGGRMTFQIGTVRIYIKFSFQLRNDNESFGGEFEVSRG